MMTTAQAWEDDPNGGHVLVTYRVRVCTRCGHEACPCCGGTWCDACFGDINEAETGVIVNEQCADSFSCVYKEPETEAVTEISREVKSDEEFEAAIRRIGGAE